MAPSKIDTNVLAALGNVQSEPTETARLVKSRNVQDNPMAAHLRATFDGDGLVHARTVGQGKDKRESWIGTPRQVRVDAKTAKPVHDLLRRAAAAYDVGSAINFLDKDGNIVPRPALPGFADAKDVRKLPGNAVVFVVFAAKEKIERTRSNGDAEDATDEDEDEDENDEFYEGDDDDRA